jgi:hypothetical protein
MANDWFFLQEESSHASCALHFHHSWENFLTTHFRQCLSLKRVGEYNRATKALQPMTPTIPLEDTIVAMCQLHPLLSYLIPPPISNYQLEHIFVWIGLCLPNCYPFVFKWAIWDVVYEHLLGCFIPEDPSLGFSELFQIAIVVACGVILRSTVLVLGASKLLVMAKDTNGFYPIGEVFFLLINGSIVLQLQGPFQEHLSPLSLEY